MMTDTELERRLRDVLCQELDGEYGPDPAWDESPAARQVAEQERRRRPQRGVRLLAVAALVTIGLGSSLVLGTPDDSPAPTGNGWIAYGMNPEDGGDQDIWFASLDGEPRRAVGTDLDRVDQLCPAFSPDGRRLAYGQVDRSGATPSMAVVVADVSSEGDVSEAFSVEVVGAPPCPIWSPTGDRIAFGVPQTSVTNPTQSAEGSAVWILTMADRGITVLPDLLATDLEFSPDGSRLAVASGRDAVVSGNQLHDGRLHLYELGSGATRILEGTQGALTFTWSPDGGRIAYQRIADASGDSVVELSVIDLATEEQRPLSTGRSGRFGAVHGIGPVWSPDGESIVYQRCRPAGCSGEDHDVVVVWPDDLSTDGTPREEVIPLIERSADGSERVLKGPYWVTWSPDGEYLLFAAWTSGIDPLLGVVSAAPGSWANLLVTAQDVVTNPVYDFGPFMPMESWGWSQL
jgi:Tol biopolymer transport system component